MSFKRRQRFHGKATGHRSGSEARVSKQLTEAGADFEYLDRNYKAAIEYSDPEVHKYRPDFQLANGIYIEVKGEFDALDRRKHLLIKSQHPELDIRFVFDRSKSKTSKGSISTYASWCQKNGFMFADKVVPESWLKERTK